MTNTVLIARGTDRDARGRSIDTICRWIRDINSNTINPDAVRGMHEWAEENAATACHRPSDDVYLYMQVGRETAEDRQGPDDPALAAFNKAAGDDPANVITDSLAGINVDDVTRLITDHRARVHDATHTMTINPTRRDRDALPVATRRALEVLTGTAAHADALLAGIEWNGGRPPFGCTSNGGRLAPADNYDRVCRTLRRVEDDDLSKSKAASLLSCARKTIDNALDRPELYRIE